MLYIKVVHCAVCRLFTVHCTMYTVQCADCLLYTVQSTLNNVKAILYMYIISIIKTLKNLLNISKSSIADLKNPPKMFYTPSFKITMSRYVLRHLNFSRKYFIISRKSLTNKYQELASTYKIK